MGFLALLGTATLDETIGIASRPTAEAPSTVRQISPPAKPTKLFLPESFRIRCIDSQENLRFRKAEEK
jgi:hypothetical protein